MDVSNVLDNGETIVWQGKPKSRMLIFATAIPALIFGGCFLGFALFWMSAALTATTAIRSVTSTGATMVSGFPLFGLPFVLIGLFIFGLPFVGMLGFKNIHYYITSKRVILSSGIIGVDFKFIDHDKIQNISVNVGVLDNLFGGGITGTISIFSGELGSTKNGTYSKNDTMYGIENPYEIVKLLKTVSHDIKTDIEYPNKLRPDVNPGYQTEYKPENGEFIKKK